MHLTIELMMWVWDGTAPSGADIGSKITHINFNASLKLYVTTYHSKFTAKKFLFSSTNI